MEQALADLELLICVDLYLNETSRHAHVLFPGESPLERPSFPFIAQWSVPRYARWSPGALPEPVRPREWEVVLTLAAMVEGRTAPVDTGELERTILLRKIERETRDPDSPIFGRHPEEILAATTGVSGPERMVDFLLRIGRDGDGYGAHGERAGGLSVNRLRESPHGIGLGPPERRTPDILATASGMIEVAPAPLVDGLKRVASVSPSLDGDFPLVLVGRRNLRSNNSWMHNVPALVKGRPQCTLLVHPRNAAPLGLVAGGMARVSSRTGSVEVAVELSEDIRPGVVSLPHGWGHDRPGVRLNVARTVAGVNSNTLGDVRLIDALTGTAVGNGIPVAVRALP
jgi:anaerobic selenocysteine-containing dehydrogenase